VTLRDGRLDIKAAAAPLSEVLGQLARQTGMKVVNEGPGTSMTLTLSLEDRTPVEAVLGMLEGLGLNYALATDGTGKRVETLILSGVAAPGPALPPPVHSYAAVSPPLPAQSLGPPESSAVGEDSEDSEEPEAAGPLADDSVEGIDPGMAIAAPQEPLVSPPLPGTPSSAGHPLRPTSPEERGLEISPLQPRFKVPGGPEAEPPR
jgi:hypothetical protein